MDVQGTLLLDPLTNVEQFWGRSAFHCPFCDGWEQRDQPLAVQGNGDNALHRVKLLLNLTDDLVICTDGPATFSAEEAQFLQHKKVRIIETPLNAITGAGTQMDTLHFADGSSLARRALFVNLRTTQQSDLAQRLGCELDVDGVSEGQRPGAHQCGWCLCRWRYDNAGARRDFGCRPRRNGGSCVKQRFAGIRNAVIIMAIGLITTIWLALPNSEIGWRRHRYQLQPAFPRMIDDTVA